MRWIGLAPHPPESPLLHEGVQVVGSSLRPHERRRLGGVYTGDHRQSVAGGQSSDRARPHAGTKHLHAKGEPELRKIGLVVGGMRCRRCVREVTARLRDVPGVETVMADTGSSVVRLAGTMTVDDVLGAFRGLTYPVKLLGEPGHAPDS